MGELCRGMGLGCIFELNWYYTASIRRSSVESAHGPNDWTPSFISRTKRRGEYNDLRITLDGSRHNKIKFHISNQGTR
ncbi:hypothetical protein KQX54_007427 [Cotesia glomerata]|uniref:Uncharacterized protein n=1 Tax=Cotesia glomerata TaxID=32391 RepID=A0AAV7I7R9_COTGL|nr:hypothetical protein KQX54_007427 [Cotesia glomerata]